MSDLYTWGGKYVGFVVNGNLFDRNGSYRGWIEGDGKAWDDQGRYLGSLVEGNYIMRSQMAVPPIPRIPRIPPIPPIPQMPRMNRIGRIPKLGYDDALEHFA
ncbi:4-fold beta flower protein [Paracoccus sp. p1-h21]|uniref:4-fold beta flower protein n=1 Tax=Paracoccus sp. p1-h21 TaxID=3366951 RepID=UPI0037BDC441